MLAAVTACLPTAPAWARSSTPDSGVYVTNGTVNAVVTSGATTYIGGKFTQVGPPTGPAVGTNSSGSDLGWARVWGGTGVINDVVGDGSGGFYIGGNFTTVGGTACKNLAHIQSNGTLQSSWCPNPNGTVNVLALSGTTLYVGGAFTTIGVGAPTRERLAAVCTVNNCEGAVEAAHATAWAPNANSEVDDIALSGTTLYVGGAFTTIGAGAPARERLAAVCTANNCEGAVEAAHATAWAPNANSTVKTIKISGSTVYAGGAFTTIGVGATVRNRIAAICATNNCEGAVEAAHATAWNPNANNEVNAIQLSGSTVYAGGKFTKIGVGEPTRNRIAAICATNNCEGAVEAAHATAWNPNANAEVSTLTVSGSTVYAGGLFTTIVGTARNYVASLNTSGTAALNSWNANANAAVGAIATYNTTVFLGGSFSSIGGVARTDLAAICATNNCEGSVEAGHATAWAPNANNEVNALALSGSTLYVGGKFTKIGVGESARERIAAICTANNCEGSVEAAHATAWAPNASAEVNAIAVSGSTVYVGGTFTTIGVGAPTRERIAAICATNGCEGSVETGHATAWAPNASNAVDTIAVSGSTVYAGGTFTTIGVGATARNRIAAICATNNCEGSVEAAHATAWNPKANAAVLDLVVSGSTLYVGGKFTKIGVGEPVRDYVAAVCTVNNCEGSVEAAHATAWAPNANAEVNAVAISGSTVFAGGAFTSIGVGSPTRERIAAICATSNCEGSVEAAHATAWAPNPSGAVNAVTTTLTTVYAGGEFATMETGDASYFASFTEVGLLTFVSAPAMPALTSITLDGESQTTHTTMTSFKVKDATAVGAGWNVTVSGHEGSGLKSKFTQYCPEAACGTVGYVAGGHALEADSLTLNSTGASFEPSGEAPTYKCGGGCNVDTGNETGVVIVEAACEQGDRDLRSQGLG